MADENGTRPSAPAAWPSCGTDPVSENERPTNDDQPGDVPSPMGKCGSDTITYDVEADWLLLNTCNFRCEYCFFSAEDLGTKTTVYAVPKAWAAGFDATGKTWLLHMTGGEPTLYQDFPDLCAAVTEKHFISVNTNLSHPNIESFAERIDPDRVNFINISVHAKERSKRSRWDSYFRRMQMLMDAGFVVFPSLVMTPEMIREYPEITKRHEDCGGAVIPKTLRGNFRGQAYPEAYTTEEWTLMAEYLESSRRANQDSLSRMKFSLTIDMFSDDDFFRDGIKDYRGRFCEAGRKFMVITPNGSAVKCGSDEWLGNVHKRIRFYPAPRACDAHYCPYFCEKYSYAPAKTDRPPVPPDMGAGQRIRQKMKRAHFYYRVEGASYLMRKAMKKLTSAD